MTKPREWPSRFPNKLGDLAAKRRLASLLQETKLHLAHNDLNEMRDIMNAIDGLTDRVRRLTARHSLEGALTSLTLAKNTICTAIRTAKP